MYSVLRERDERRVRVRAAITTRRSLACLLPLP